MVERGGFIPDMRRSLRAASKKEILADAAGDAVVPIVSYGDDLVYRVEQR